MRSAFGVEHGDTSIEKFSMKPLTTAFKAGWNNPSIKMTPGGAAATMGADKGVQGNQLRAAKLGSHLQRNKQQYKVGGIAGGSGVGAGAVGTSMYQNRNRGY